MKVLVQYLLMEKTKKTILPVATNKKQVSITKTELLNLMDKAKSSKTPFNYNYSNFRSIVNGLFQAEGHWPGYFLPTKDIQFRPLWFISQKC